MNNEHFEEEIKSPMLTFMQAKRLHIIYKMKIEGSGMGFEEFCRMLEILYISNKSEIESSDLNVYDFFENLFKSYEDESIEIIEKDEGIEGEVCIPIKLKVKLYCDGESKVELIDNLISDLNAPREWMFDAVISAIHDREYEIDEENIYFIEEE